MEACNIPLSITDKRTKQKMNKGIEVLTNTNINLF